MNRPKGSALQPLIGATSVVHAIAGGDLASRFDNSRKGDTGQPLQALQQMSVNLTAIIGDVRTNIRSIELATGNIELSSRCPKVE